MTENHDEPGAAATCDGFGLPTLTASRSRAYGHRVDRTPRFIYPGQDVVDLKEG